MPPIINYTLVDFSVILFVSFLFIFSFSNSLHTRAIKQESVGFFKDKFRTPHIAIFITERASRFWTARKQPSSFEHQKIYLNN